MSIYYTGGYFDFTDNYNHTLYRVYNDLNEIKYDLNEKILFVLSRKYNIVIPNEYLYILLYKNKNKIVPANVSVLSQRYINLLFNKYPDNTINIKIECNGDYPWSYIRTDNLYQFYIRPISLNITQESYSDPFESPITNLLNTFIEYNAENIPERLSDSINEIENEISINEIIDTIKEIDPFLEELKTKIQKFKIE